MPDKEVLLDPSLYCNKSPWIDQSHWDMSYEAMTLFEGSGWVLSLGGSVPYNYYLMARYLIINNWHWIPKLAIPVRIGDPAKTGRCCEIHQG